MIKRPDIISGEVFDLIIRKDTLGLEKFIESLSEKELSLLIETFGDEYFSIVTQMSVNKGMYD